MEHQYALQALGADLNRVLAAAVQPPTLVMTEADWFEPGLGPLDRRDLILVVRGLPADELAKFARAMNGQSSEDYARLTLRHYEQLGKVSIQTDRDQTPPLLDLDMDRTSVRHDELLPA